VKKFSTIVDAYKAISLQGKIFYLLVSLCGIFTLINGVLNIFLGLSLFTVLITFSTSALCIFLFIYALKTSNYVKASYVTFHILILFVYPTLWITNGGSTGPTPYFLIFNSMLIAIMLDNKKTIRLMVKKLIIVIFLLLIEIFVPSWIMVYSNASTQSLDLAISAILIGFFTLLIIQRLMYEYNARIIDLNEVQRKLHKLSITDDMTGIFNRRYIIQAITDQLDDSEHQSFSIIMFDIDNFKHINDHLGHSYGDEVIRRISQLLESLIRPVDVVGRIGGEEFLVLLMDTEDEYARKRADFIRQTISELNWSIPDLAVTVSGGIYERNSEDALDDILEKVDQYLYEAKSSGKNVIV